MAAEMDINLKIRHF